MQGHVETFPKTLRCLCLTWRISSKLHQRLVYGLIFSLPFCVYYLWLFIYLVNHWKVCFEKGGQFECVKLKARKLTGFLCCFTFMPVVAICIKHIGRLDSNAQISQMSERVRELSNKIQKQHDVIQSEHAKKLYKFFDWTRMRTNGPFKVMRKILESIMSMQLGDDYEKRRMLTGYLLATLQCMKVSSGPEDSQEHPPSSAALHNFEEAVKLLDATIPNTEHFSQNPHEQWILPPFRVHQVALPPAGGEQERRTDPTLGNRAVTYAEMRSRLADQGLSEQQLRQHWASLQRDVF